MRKLGLSQAAVQRIGKKLAQHVVHDRDNGLLQLGDPSQIDQRDLEESFDPSIDYYQKNVAVPTAVLPYINSILQKAQSLLQAIGSDPSALGEAGSSLIYNVKELINKLEDDKSHIQEQINNANQSMEQENDPMSYYIS